jgi:hypothetical protein
MENYEKPVIIVNEDVSEGVYAASGGAADDSGGSGNESYGAKPKCDSKYMGGVFHAPKWNGTTNMESYGCNGCPADRSDQRCALTEPELEDPSRWDSYRADDGQRMPRWEMLGYAPNDMNYF